MSADTRQVTIETADSPWGAQVVSTLPMSFSPTTRDADVRVVDGGPGWTKRAAEAATGARAIVVVDPIGGDAGAVRSLDDTGVPVVLAEAWAGSPAVLNAVTAWAEAISEAMTIDVHILAKPSASTAELLLRAFRVLRRLGQPVSTIESLLSPSGGLAGLGRAENGASIVLFGAWSAIDELHVDVLEPGSSTQLVLYPPENARPSESIHATAQGAVRLPTVYETAHREAFRVAHRLASRGKRSNALKGFAADLELVDTALALAKNTE
jgi:hypothetical protein